MFIRAIKNRIGRYLKMIMTIREFCRLILGDGNCDLIEETKLDEKLLIEKNIWKDFRSIYGMFQTKSGKGPA